jgi:hypothetical protein
MAKQSMIQREIKRENLIAKYETKREVLKQQLNSSDGYKFIKNLKRYLEIHQQYDTVIVVGLQVEVVDFTETSDYRAM